MVQERFNPGNVLGEDDTFMDVVDRLTKTVRRLDKRTGSDIAQGNNFGIMAYPWQSREDELKDKLSQSYKMRQKIADENNRLRVELARVNRELDDKERTLKGAIATKDELMLQEQELRKRNGLLRSELIAARKYRNEVLAEKQEQEAVVVISKYPVVTMPPPEEA